ncbi:LD-carboxypeptidase, partial [Pseudomonas sp. NBRC 111127]
MNCVDSVHLHLPKATPQDACFAIIAPAGAARLDPGKVSQWFAERGYRCRIFPGALQAQGYLAGPDQQRLQDLHDAFADPAIDAILCMRGGYGS